MFYTIECTFPIVPKAASSEENWLEEKPLQTIQTDVNKAFDDILLHVFEEYPSIEDKNIPKEKKEKHKYLSKKKKEKYKK